MPTLATFMATSDSGLLSVSLPVIMAEFDADVASAGWIILIYSPVAGWLSEKMSPRVLASIGLTIMGVSLISIGFLPIKASSVEVVTRLAFLGFGLGLYQTPNNNSLMSSIPENRLGLASSFLSMIRSVGQSVGTALATSIVSATLLAVAGQISLQDLRLATPVERTPLLLTAFMQGYWYTYFTAALFCFAGAAFSLIGEGQGRKRTETN